MILNEWAQRWGVPLAAIEDLRATLNCAAQPETLSKELSEGGVQSRVRLAAARKGIYAWRNNVGAGTLGSGSYIRWGLANDSKALNKKIKSADLIGIRRRLITGADVGTELGQFWSREVKHSQWVYRDTEEEAAQLQWALLITANGGDAGFITDANQL